MRIAAYLRTVLEPQVDGLEWETRWYHLRQTKSRRLKSKYTMSMLALYGTVAAACLGLSAYHMLVYAISDWLIFVIAAVSIATLTVLSMAMLSRQYGVDTADNFAQLCQQCLDNEAF
jgi:hypothetical protein